MVHGEYPKGLTYLILVFLILVYRNILVQDFFGAPALAVLILLHQALFGFNPLPLIITFVIFSILRVITNVIILWPISIYLLLDTVYYYFQLDKIFDSYFNSFSHKVFSQDMIGVVAFLPLSYLYFRVERFVRNRKGNSFIGNYGAPIIIGVIMCIFIPLGYWLDNLVLILIGNGSFLIYIIGIMQFRKILQLLISFLPALFLLVELYLLRIIRN